MRYDGNRRLYTLRSKVPPRAERSVDLERAVGRGKGGVTLPVDVTIEPAMDGGGCGDLVLRPHVIDLGRLRDLPDCDPLERVREELRVLQVATRGYTRRTGFATSGVAGGWSAPSMHGPWRRSMGRL